MKIRHGNDNDLQTVFRIPVFYTGRSDRCRQRPYGVFAFLAQSAESSFPRSEEGHFSPYLSGCLDEVPVSACSEKLGSPSFPPTTTNRSSPSLLSTEPNTQGFTLFFTHLPTHTSYSKFSKQNGIPSSSSDSLAGSGRRVVTLISSLMLTPSHLSFQLV